MLVFRATVPPDVHFCVLDAAGVEIGRIVEEEMHSQNGQAWLVLYDRQHTRVLEVEKAEYDSDGGRGDPATTVIDGRDQLVTSGTDWRGWIRDASGQRIGRLKHSFRGPTLLHTTIQDSTKTEVGSFDLGRPPDGDHRLGLTFVLTITADITSELRLAALGYVISFTEQFGKPGWMLKHLPKVGLAWPGSALGPDGR